MLDINKLEVKKSLGSIPPSPPTCCKLTLQRFFYWVGDFKVGGKEGHFFRYLKNF